MQAYDGDRALSVLEVGAGTGAVTSVLIPRLPDRSCLDIVEADPHFADHLRGLVNDLAAPDMRATVQRGH
ncbi:hypothetical protein [Rhodococcus wratislaviensis]|uniref:Methyltransferase n=1 Tax=Rhodococcus wratislaviensis NBRC 100605 TaxID=1219028 RepID=X0PTT2_RHOWR|nr:hypothetical protein [Rhodococcus wratislaviensis]GAF46514.1 hypothetical protein RW1_031_00980 [Rhodococcus wratislaviensis NBRC 100605]